MYEGMASWKNEKLLELVRAKDREIERLAAALESAQSALASHVERLQSSEPAGPGTTSLPGAAGLAEAPRDAGTDGGGPAAE